MKTYSDRTETYIGRGAGKEIAEEISKPNDFCICIIRHIHMVIKNE